MSRSDYTARINRVLDHIETNLAEPLQLEELARVAAFSPYHFHRVFAAHTGETLQRFVQRRRLERAAMHLRGHPGRSITEVALDNGFSSSATFARAFRARFGVTASEWRDGPAAGGDRNLGNTVRNGGQAVANGGKAFQVEASYGGPRNNPLRWRITMKTETTLTADVTVQPFDTMHVAYLRHVGPYQGDGELFGRLWGELCKWAGPRGLLAAPDVQMLCLYHDDPNVTEDARLRLDVCITVPADTEVSGEIGKMTLAGGDVAVARFELDPDQYGDAWTAIYGGWLPESGYQPDDRPAFERMVGDPKDHPEGKHVVDICVPVKPA